MKKSGLVIVSVFAIALVTMLAPTPAAACTCFCDSICEVLGDCCWLGCGGGIEAATTIDSSVSVTPVGERGAQIQVIGALTMAMEGATSCVAGVPQLSGVASVDSIHLKNVTTGEVIYEFHPNRKASATLSKLGQNEGPRGLAQDWDGFHAYVADSVPSGIATAFEINVTLAEDTSFRDLVFALRSGGALSGGSAHADGALDFHHYFVRGLAEMPIAIRSPSR